MEFTLHHPVFFPKMLTYLPFTAGTHNNTSKGERKKITLTGTRSNFLESCHHHCWLLPLSAGSTKSRASVCVCELVRSVGIGTPRYIFITFSGLSISRTLQSRQGTLPYIFITVCCRQVGISVVEHD